MLDFCFFVSGTELEKFAWDSLDQTQRSRIIKQNIIPEISIGEVIVLVQQQHFNAPNRGI
jgi:hypothetical protein